MEKQKLRRRRINPSHRWTESQTLHLLQAVVETIGNNSELFEKPTSQRFYERFYSKSSSLQPISWIAMKSKMRHLKSTYISAATWKEQTGSAGLLSKDDEPNVVSYISRICPHYDLLDEVFGQKKRSTRNQDLSSAAAVYESTNDVDVVSLLIAIQEKKLELEMKKFELEKDKERNRVELKKLELQNELQIRRLEIEEEGKLRMEELRLASQERIKRYEIDLNLKTYENELKQI